MKRYFGRRPDGGNLLKGRWWYWDEETRQGWWVDGDGSNPETSEFRLERWTVEYASLYMEIPRLPVDVDLQMDEGL